ncbi:hypothetical protein [Streptococcus merionis]
MNQDIMQAFELMDAGQVQDALDVLDSLNGVIIQIILFFKIPKDIATVS